MKRFALLFVLFAAALGVTLGASAIATPPSDPPASAPLKAAAPAEKPTPAPAEPAPVDEEEAAAQEVLSDLQSRYSHLDDVTVRMGSTPQGHQAIAYYTEGEIVINPAHTASIENILEHEVWHVIDWRDNGKLDWGENLPPSNTADYMQ